MLNSSLKYLQCNWSRQLQASDLLFASMIFAALLLIPGYFSAMYKVTYSMGGFRVPLIKFSWYFSLFFFINLLWITTHLIRHFVLRQFKHKEKLSLISFLLSHIIGSIAIISDFANYNLFSEHWNFTNLTAAFYGITGGQTPLGILPSQYIAAILAITIGLLLLILIVKFVPRPLALASIKQTQLSFGIIAALLVLITVQRIMPTNWHAQELQKNIPWITYVVSENPYYIDDAVLLQQREIEQKKAAILKRIQKKAEKLPQSLSAEHRPNLLFVHVEGMRADMLTPKHMPKMSAIAASHADVLKHHYSSSNNTGQSIFSLLSGLPGAYYQNFRQNPGVVAPLEILQRLGYRFEVHNSVHNDYQQLDTLFFTQFEEHSELSGDLATREQKLFVDTSAQLKRFTQGDQPRMDYVFLNSTHFPYDYPESHRKFTPALVNISYDPTQRDEIEKNRDLLKNSFYNSVYFADTLLASLIKPLLDTEYWRNTIVVIVGDHGQEFWEHNRMGHVYSLVKEQTHVLAITSFPEQLNSPYRYTSHHDIFPTIFNKMGINTDYSKLMNGKDLSQYDADKDFALVHMSVLSTQKRYEEAVISRGLKVQYHLKDKLVIQAVTDETDEPITDFDNIKKDVYNLIKKALNSKTADLPEVP